MKVLIKFLNKSSLASKPLIAVGVMTLLGQCAPAPTNNPADPSSDAFLVANLIHCSLQDEKCANGNNDNSSGSGTSSAGSNFYIYAVNSTVTGNFGNRAASSVSCQSLQSASFPGLICTNHLAVLSYSGGDDLAGAVANHGVPSGRAIHSSSELEIAPDWATFLAGPLTRDLQTANVVSNSPTPYYWTSSSAGGAYHATYNCSDNLDGSMGSLGAMGAISSSAGTHLSFAVNQPCDGSMNTAYMMCMCWN